tara:strand:+ start:10349 stop:10564 length:216 start_codon:yes stop_codon:yes gene_type:complete
MAYVIGLFCLILAIVIGISTVFFRLPQKRALGLVAALMIASACLIGIGVAFPPSSAVQPIAQDLQQGGAHE